MFTTPVPDDPLVAVIGGGMSGLICAKHLEKRGVRSTVFDTVAQLLPYLFIYLLVDVGFEWLCMYFCGVVCVRDSGSVGLGWVGECM